MVAARLPAVTSRTSILCHTTSTTPARPMNTPAHWPGASRACIQREAMIAVRSGCDEMISAVTPADMPRYWA